MSLDRSSEGSERTKSGERHLSAADVGAFSSSSRESNVRSFSGGDNGADHLPKLTLVGAEAKSANANQETPASQDSARKASKEGESQQKLWSTPDGPRLMTEKEATTKTEHNKDGSVTKHYVDGSKETTYKDGHKEKENPDSVVAEAPWRNPKREYTQPDGSKSKQYQYPSRVVFEDKDGKVIFEMPGE